MVGPLTGRRSCLLGCIVTLVLAIAGSAPAAPPSPYERAYRLGLEAYTYGLPLLVLNKTFLTMTSVNVPNNGTAFGPVNVFNHQRTLNTPGSGAVVAPGANALSSIAWVDLTDEPQVLHVPLVPDHFFVLALLDPYTENLVNLSSANSTPPGDYAICGPRQRRACVVTGTRRIDVDYSRIWIIGSTQLKGAADLPNVNRIQDEYTLTPLSKYGSPYEPGLPANPITTVTVHTLPSGLEFFDVLGDLLAAFPPGPADWDLLRELATVGIAPRGRPSENARLTADTRRGLVDAVAAGPATIEADAQALFLAGARFHDGYWMGGFGAYGTNYVLRAVVAQKGLGAFTPEQAIYAMTETDRNLQPLNGSSTYVLHMAGPPPVRETWTLTVYELNGTLVPNAVQRYQVSNDSPLAYNANGSVDIYLRPDPPSDPSLRENWIPTPGGAGFTVIWRLIAPDRAEIRRVLSGRGWQPPAIALVR